MTNVKLSDPTRSRRWAPYLQRYRQGECRDRIFHDMILDDAQSLGKDLTFLDIGCGRGFDDSMELQQSLAAHAGRYLGVEPDHAVTPGEYVQYTYRSLFENAPVLPGSVDVAFAVMVLEHLAEPQFFWDKLYDVLRDGGIFWGLTVDGRHWITHASYWTERLNVKDLYLSLILGRRGEDRYLNYPVYYRTNTPRQIAPYVERFRSCELINFSRVGQCNPYYPRCFHPLANCLDRLAIGMGSPGTLLAVRVEK